jgi:outer membrane PBP1 activator LpoA protein
MITWRLAVPAIVVAAALAGCFTYFVSPLATVPAQLPEKSPELRTGIPANIDRSRADEKADDFLQAAQAILKQEPNAQASADKPTVTGHIPLPKKRPIPR